ncbi:MAG TPA: adenylyltransferase/cytidyltransferase family protein [Ktedonobacterales bacterium]
MTIIEHLSPKIQDRVSLAAILRERQAAGQTVVFTNGCFDLLHLGHVRYLQEARALGDLLVIGLNSDDSARALKGPNRPLVPQDERAEVLAALACVDYVTICEEITAVALIEALRPNVYVKGGDYATSDNAGARVREACESAGTQFPQAPAAEGAAQPAAINYAKLPEAAPVLAAGGQVRLISYVPGHSTTELIERIAERFGSGAGGH